MKTLKESAETWATTNVNATGYDPLMLVVWRAGAQQAYLAGARAMQLEAYGIAFNGNGSDAADCAVNIANQIKSIPTE